MCVSNREDPESNWAMKLHIQNSRTCMGSHHEKLMWRLVPVQQLLQSPRAGNIWIIWIHSEQTGVLLKDCVVSAN